MRPPEEENEIHHHHASHGHGSHGGTRRDHVVISTVVVGVALFLLVGTPYLRRQLPRGGNILNSIGDRSLATDRAPDREADRPIDRAADREGDRDRRREAEAAQERVSDRAPVHVSDRGPDRLPDHGRLPDRGPVRGSNRDERDRDPDREAVRRWLRENGDDPQPRELRWWPARALESFYRERLTQAREAAEDDPRLAEQAQQLEEDAPDRVCRLKYRTTNEAGKEITRDELFLLENGKARLLAGDSSLAIAARKAFADGEERP